MSACATLLVAKVSCVGRGRPTRAGGPAPQWGLATVLLVAAVGVWAADPPVHFYPDDPIRAEPKPRAVPNPSTQDIADFADFVIQSVKMKPRPATASLAVNTLGEVPDSEWYTNRHATRRMPVAELKRGPGSDRAPVKPFVVVGAKTQGITPGFRMKDSKGRLYFMKPDPKSNPEMATAADVVGSKFFYALGYFTPENYIIELRPEDLDISPEAKITGASGKRRDMNKDDLGEVFERVPRTKTGTYRFLASLAADGKPVGPFRYEGTRSDDPNDIVLHERRRDLRGLSVFCAWLNHTDTKAGNSLDTVIDLDGTKVIRHYLIDFGAIMGSDSDMPKNPRFGHEFIMPPGSEAGKDIASLGIHSKPWEHAHFPDIPAVGNFEAETFVPEYWHSNYPNPAFVSAQAGDRFWAAKKVMAFTEDDIRAIVETGQYTDQRAVDYITKTLVTRRDKIGRAYLTGLALDNFRVENGRLVYDDLAAKYGFGQSSTPRVRWSSFNNDTGNSAPLNSSPDFALPPEARQGGTGQYFQATITGADEGHRIDVFVRGLDVVGVRREPF